VIVKILVAWCDYCEWR